MRQSNALEKALDCSLIAMLSQQDIEFGTVLIDCSPQQISLATQRDEHLVEVPRATRLTSRRFHAMRGARAELVAPASD